MSNLEVLGAFSSVIAIVELTVQAYHGAKHVHSLPEVFREAAIHLRLVQTILVATKRYIEEGSLDEDSWEGVSAAIKACEEKTSKLRAIFQKVIPTDGAPRLKRYISAVRTVGKGSRVETLMKGVLEDTELLTKINESMNYVTDTQRRELAEAIKIISGLQSSISKDAIQEFGFLEINSSTGPQTNYNPLEAQNNHFSGRKIYDA